MHIAEHIYMNFCRPTCKSVISFIYFKIRRQPIYTMDSEKQNESPSAPVTVEMVSNDVTMISLNCTLTKTSAADVAETSDGPGTTFFHSRIGVLMWLLLFALGIIIYSSYTIFVHLCEVDGRIPWSSGSVVFITEIAKFAFSFILLAPTLGWGEWTRPSLMTVASFSVPALLYSLNNNLAVYIQLQMDPATYQVLGNLKILTTAFLYRLIIKKPISPIQWLSLGILVMAGVSNSVMNLREKNIMQGASVLHVTPAGLLMISVYCTISGLAGVYTEYVLKRQLQMSIHLQNCLLYAFGIVLNGAIFLTQAMQFTNKAEGLQLLRGYTVYTWALIGTQAAGGIIMGVIMKYSSNIARLFLISSAMLVTTVLSMAIFHLQINPLFCVTVPPPPLVSLQCLCICIMLYAFVLLSGRCFLCQCHYAFWWNVTDF